MTWFAQVGLHFDPLQFLIGMFGCYSEYISHDSISTHPTSASLIIHQLSLPFVKNQGGTLSEVNDTIVCIRGLMIVEFLSGFSSPATWKGSITLFLYCSCI